MVLSDAIEKANLKKNFFKQIKEPVLKRIFKITNSYLIAWVDHFRDNQKMISRLFKIARLLLKYITL